MAIGSAVSGAAFTTFNAHVDGAKEYVWLNGRPEANGLGPDEEYFLPSGCPAGSRTRTTAA